MKTSFEALVVAAIITLVMALMSPTAATAEEGTCILKAYPDDVYLVVYDWDCAASLIMTIFGQKMG